MTFLAGIIGVILRDLVDNTPGITMSMILDEEGLPVYSYPDSRTQKSQLVKAAIASFGLLGAAEKASGQLELDGLKEVLVKTDKGCIYGQTMKSSIGRAFIVRSDPDTSTGALFMAVHEAGKKLIQISGEIRRVKDNNYSALADKSKSTDTLWKNW